MQTDAMRERMFTMRLSELEGDRLDALAKHYGLNAVGVIRMLLKRDGDVVFGKDFVPVSGTFTGFTTHPGSYVLPSARKAPAKKPARTGWSSKASTAKTNHPHTPLSFPA